MASQDDPLSQPSSFTNLPGLRTSMTRVFVKKQASDYTSYFPFRIKCSHCGYYYLENEKTDFRGKNKSTHTKNGKKYGVR